MSVADKISTLSMAIHGDKVTLEEHNTWLQSRTDRELCYDIKWSELSTTDWIT